MWFFLIFAAAWTAWVVGSDLRHRRIPNCAIWLGLGVLATVAAMTGRWGEAVIGAVTWWALGTAPPLLAGLWRPGLPRELARAVWWGGGDSKLALLLGGGLGIAMAGKSGVGSSTLGATAMAVFLAVGLSGAIHLIVHLIVAGITRMRSPYRLGMQALPMAPAMCGAAWMVTV